MSLHEEMENQALRTSFMLEVPEANIPEFTGADGKDEIVSKKVKIFFIRKGALKSFTNVYVYVKLLQE